LRRTTNRATEFNLRPGETRDESIEVPWLGVPADIDLVVIVRRPSAFVLSGGFRLYPVMIDFFEYIARSRKMTLPDTHTMLSMAGVPLDVPDEEQTKWLLNLDRKRNPAPMSGGTRKTTPPLLGGRLKAPAG
jgi:hypothetical protein